MPLESAFDSAPQPEHFDPAALRHDLFDSTPALLNVLHTFHPWLADMRARLQAAVDAGDTRQLAGTIHTLRGGLAQLRAKSAVELVRQLEAVCKADPTAPLASDDPGLLALEAKLEALAAEMTEFLACSQPVVPPRQS